MPLDGCTEFFGSLSVVLFGSIILSHSKTANATVVSFLNLYTKRSNQNTQQFRRVVNSLQNECFDIQP